MVVVMKPNNKNRDEFQLLVEIAKLLTEYGPEAFDRLALRLATPGFADQLASILTSSAKSGRGAQDSVQFPRQLDAKPEAPLFLAELHKNDPDKAKLLSDFYNDAMTRRVLATLNDLRRFMKGMGLPSTKIVSREDAVSVLLEPLSVMPYGDLKKRLDSIKPVPEDDDRSLQGWSDIILGKHKQTKGP